MSRKFFIVLALLAVFALALSACGGQKAAETAQPQPTNPPVEQPTKAPEPTSAPAAVVGDAAAGEALFNQDTIGNAPGCKTCHSVEPNTVIVGPSLYGMADDAAEDNPDDPAAFLRETIVDPNADIAGGFQPNIMYQNYGKDLSEQQIADLIAYLLTLKGGEEGGMAPEGDAVRGGLLYDKWWDVTGADEPTEPHPLWKGEAESAADTWRCTACHGWFFTGEGDNPGILNLKGEDADEILPILKGSTNPDHDFSAVMEEQDLVDLALFISQKTFDASEIVTAEGKPVNGDAAAGETAFQVCAACHGPEGMAINFHHDEEEPPEYIPTIAQEDPGEFLSKAHWGQPGHPEMPAGDSLGFTTQDYANLLAYLQQFPTSSPLTEGGQMYDNWWKAAVVDEPQGEMPLWANADMSKAENEDEVPEGADTWRCSTCHGWDYQGEFGFPGIWEAQNKSADEIMAALTAPDHDFSQYLDADRLSALVDFIQNGLVDKSQYINADDTVNGDAEHGQQMFSAVCTRCHGADGTEINFHEGTDEPPEYVGNVASAEIWEFFNKASFGQPGEAMPAGLNMGWTWQDIADLAAYAQTLPSGK